MQSTIVARGGVGTVTVEGRPGDRVHLRAAGSSADLGQPVTFDLFGGAFFPQALLSGEAQDLDATLPPGLYELWVDPKEPEGVAEVEMLEFGATVAVRTDTAVPYASQDLIAQSSPVHGSELKRFGYLQTRDGTLLSFYLQLPIACSATDPHSCTGAVPTLLEYSVYDTSNPDLQPETRLTIRDGDRFVEEGYALLAVNARGTGCSAGALQPSPATRQEALDGYDVVETLAAQPWANGKVGMVGTSYVGIAQIPVAATNPPHLKAVTPAAVPSSAYEVAYPGGIPTNLFDGWSDFQVGRSNAHPNVQDGTWIYDRVVGGDHTCAANVADRGNRFDWKSVVNAHPLLRSSNDPWETVNTRKLLEQTHVPTLLIDGLGDPQMELGFDAMFEPTSSLGGPPVVLGTDPEAPGSLVRVVTGNGDHHHAYTLEGHAERAAFLDLLVKGALPTGSCLPTYLDPDDDGDLDVPDIEGALDELYTAPPIVSYWDQQYVSSDYTDEHLPPMALNEPPEPIGTSSCHTARFRSTSSTWPNDEAVAEPWFLEGDVLADEGASTSGESTYENVKRGGASPAGSVQSQSALPLDGEAVVVTSEPFGATTAYQGTASATLFLKATRPVVDLEVSLYDVAPDGSETRIRTGWLRSCMPPASGGTALRPQIDLGESSCRPDLDPGSPGACDPEICLDAATFTEVDVPLPSFAYIVREDHRLRVRISAPGYGATAYRFVNAIDGSATDGTVTVGYGGSHASHLNLPAVDDPTPLPGQAEDAIDTAPPCGSLRGHPCLATAVTADVTDDAAEAGEREVLLEWQRSPWLDVTEYRIYRDNGTEPIATLDASSEEPPSYPFRTEADHNPEIPVRQESVTIPDDSEPHWFTVVPIRDVTTAHPGRGQLSHMRSNTVYANRIDERAAHNESSLYWSDLSGGSLDLVSGGHDGSATALEFTPGTSGPQLALPGLSACDMGHVEGGGQYRFEAWVAGAGHDTHAGVIAVWWDDEGNASFDEDHLVDLDADDEWTRIAFDAEAPPGTAFGALAMATDDEVGGKPFLIDDVVMYERPGSRYATGCAAEE